MTDSSRASEILGLYEELRAAAGGRNAEYDRARRILRGEHWDENNPPPVGRYSLTVNYIRPAVRNAVRDLFARMPGIQVYPRGVDEPARRIAEGAEGLLYRCYEQNSAIEVFRRAAHNQVLLRRGLLYLWWDAKGKCARFRSVNPSDFYPLYDGEDIVECILVTRRLASVLRAQFPNATIRSDSDLMRATADRASKVSAGVTDALGDGGTGDGRESLTGYATVIDWFHRDGRWVRVVGDEIVKSATIGDGSGEVPFIEVANDYAGDESEPEPEIPADVVELNQYLDRLVSQQADVIARYANPTIIDQGSGQDPATVRRVVQGDGAVLPIRKDAQIRFLNWDGPMPAFAEQREAIRDFLHDLSGRPRAAYGQTVTNQSGVMTNLAMNPTVSTAQDRQTVWGAALAKLNERILRLHEKMAPGEPLSYEGYRPAGAFMRRQEYFSVQGFKSGDLGGWYRNQIKWPSVLRTDDPVYVQNVMTQMTSDPPAMSVYDAIEALGHDDAEGMGDRIKAQLEDPRFHPDRLKTAVDASMALQGGQLPTDLNGLMPQGMPEPGGTGLGIDPAAVAGALEGAGNPNRDQLTK